MVCSLLLVLLIGCKKELRRSPISRCMWMGLCDFGLAAKFAVSSASRIDFEANTVACTISGKFISYIKSGGLLIIYS